MWSRLEFSSPDTQIDDLIAINDEMIIPQSLSDLFFISTWNKEHGYLDYNHNSLFSIMEYAKNDLNKYFFCDELQETKKIVCKALSYEEDINLHTSEIAIFNNGTSAIFNILFCLKTYGIKSALLISPTYFTNIKVLKSLNVKSLFFLLKENDGFNYDMEKINTLVKQFNIDLIIVTDPLFGVGKSISQDNYQDLFKISRDNNLWILIDYIYGGLEWNTPHVLCNSWLIKHVKETPKAILCDSIAKKFFLNGIKYCFVYSNIELIKDLESQSVYVSGSLCFPQIRLVEKMLERQTLDYLKTMCDKIICSVSSNYTIVKTALLGTNIKIAQSDSGIFTLIGLPRKGFISINDIEIAKEIFVQSGILTIPHSRYNLKDLEYYFFRVNLAFSQGIIMKYISKLLLEFNN